MTKKKAQKIHWMNRCNERLGGNIPAKKIKDMILKDELQLIKKSSKKIYKYLYHHDDEKDYIIIYDRIRKQPVTIFCREEKDG